MNKNGRRYTYNVKLNSLIILPFCALIAAIHCLDDDEFPDITDLFPKVHEDSDSSKNAQDSYQGMTVENATFDIDIGKLDMKKFRRSMEAIETELLNGTDNENRRQMPFFNQTEMHNEWKQAQWHYSKVKVLDTLLQLIYMARHKVRELENQPMFNSKDTAFRIGFLYRNFRRLWKRILDIYTYMTKDSNHYSSKRITSYIQLHHRAAKLHTEFTYLWWVMVKLHERYNERTHIKMTSPHTTAEFVTTKPKYKYSKIRRRL